MIHIRLLLTGAKEAVAEAEAVAGAMTATGSASTKANAAQAAGMTKTATATEKAARTYRTMGKAAMWGLGILGVGGVFALKAAFDKTQALGAATKTLMRMTNMDARTASKWVQVTEARGIATSQLQMGMGTLAKQITAANKGGKTQLELFESLGVSADDLKNKDMGAIIGQVSEAFKNMPKGAEQTAAFKTLFGRSGTNMMSLLQGGKEGLADAMGKAGGISQDQLDKIMEAKEAQRDMKLAIDDLVNTLSIALIPVLTVAANGLKDFAQGLSDGAPWAIAFAAAIGGLALAFTLLGIAAGIAWVIALSPLELALIGIAAFAAAFVVLYTKVGWFHDAVDAVWGFLKNHWPLLVPLFGPIGIAIALIATHFGEVKKAGVWAFNAVKNSVNWVGGAIDNVQDKLVAFKSTMNDLKDDAKDLISSIPGADSAAGAVGVNLDTPEFTHMQRGGGTPGQAVGGNTIGAGLSWVGEKGPELLRLPRGAKVRPLGSRDRNYPQPIAAGAFGGGAVTVPVYLDKRQIALAQADFADDENARS